MIGLCGTRDLCLVQASIEEQEADAPLDLAQLRAMQATDRVTVERLYSAIADYETKLGRLKRAVCVRLATLRLPTRRTAW